MQNIAAQRHRMNRVVNHARSHVSDALDLDAMADVACLSKYHFSRVFAAHFDQTPSQFLARVRLELAARKLVYRRDDTITQIAMDCGFSGSDAFSRAFRARFGSAPRTFKASNRWSFDAFDDLHPFATEIHKPDAKLPHLDLSELQVRIERRPAQRVAYVRHIGPYGDVDGSISETFRLLQHWAKLRGIMRHDTTYIGLSFDNCSTTPARHCIYDACLVLTDDVSEDDVVSVQTVPAATYAVLDVTCRTRQLNRMWNWLTTTWLPDSGWRLSFGARYERFAGFGDWPVTSEHGVELCLPVRR